MLAASPPPPVTIIVSDREETVATGTEPVYTIEVRNDGDDDYPDAVISQLLPAGLGHKESGPAADVAVNEVTWHVSLPAHGKVTVTMTGTVTDAAAGRGGVSTTACVRAEPGEPLAACATDADVLTVERPGPSPMLLLTGAALIAGAAAVGGFLLWRRRPSADAA